MKTSIGSLRVRRLSACLAAALGIGIGGAHAGITPVTNCGDDGSDGTLRVLAGAATNDQAFDVSGCSTITLTQGEIPLAVSVAIVGPQPPGSGTTTIDANHNGRAFHSTSVTAGYGNLLLASVTVTGGRDHEANKALGGCILGGYVTLQDSLVTDCMATSDNSAAYGGAIAATVGSAAASGVLLVRSRVENSGAYATVDGVLAGGGGVFTYGNLNCSDSSISGNQAVGSGSPGTSEGGGLLVNRSVLISGCTVDSNTSQYSAGLLEFGVSGSSVTIINSTISGNHATSFDGGLFAFSPLTLRNSTVAANRADGACAGVRAYAIDIESSIVADNRSGGPGCVDLVSINSMITGMNNLVAVVDTAVPADTLVADPLLTPLADHGGPTRTHGLSLNSPAIDAGSNPAALPYDQRGVPYSREVGVADIGAFERQAGDDELFYGGFN